MKVRNKLNGEINILKVDEDYFKIYKDDGEFVCPVTLKELNEGWEDAPEEPKEYWFIDIRYPKVEPKKDINLSNSMRKRLKEIGNYFSSQEEAEKAVEKLKAWKRLKDKGFRFIEGWLDNNDDFIIKAKLGHVGLIDQPDVHLIFGGEDGE